MASAGNLLVASDALQACDAGHVAVRAGFAGLVGGAAFEAFKLVVFRDARLAMTGGAEFGRLGMGFVGDVGVEQRIGAGGRSVHGAVGVDVAHKAGDAAFAVSGSEFRKLADPGDEDGFGRVAGVAGFFAVRDLGCGGLVDGVGPGFGVHGAAPFAPDGGVAASALAALKFEVDVVVAQLGVREG